MKTALIIVDGQIDFCEGGKLGVTGGNRVARAIAALLSANPSMFDLIVTTQDWHIDPGSHFSDNPDFVDSWPYHCLATTTGAMLHPEIEAALYTRDDVISVRKGHYTDAYSGFQGITDDGRPLADVLREQSVENLLIVGIATDHCVKATALDAITEGFAVTVGTDLCAGVAEAESEKAVEAMSLAGCEII